MSSRTRQLIYALMAIAGIGLTWYFNIQFVLQQGGFSFADYTHAINVNPAASSISIDIFAAAFTFVFWSFFEARKLGMRHWWIYIFLTFGIAMAFAFPLFLLMRERKIEAGKV
jgi:Terpene cyclase DEP1